MKKLLLFAVIAGLGLPLLAKDTQQVKINTNLRWYEVPEKDQSRNALQIKVTNNPWSCKIQTNAKPMTSSKSSSKKSTKKSTKRSARKSTKKSSRKPQIRIRL